MKQPPAFFIQLINHVGNKHIATLCVPTLPLVSHSFVIDGIGYFVTDIVWLTKRDETQQQRFVDKPLLLDNIHVYVKQK